MFNNIFYILRTDLFQYHKDLLFFTGAWESFHSVSWNRGCRRGKGPQYGTSARQGAWGLGAHVVSWSFDLKQREISIKFQFLFRKNWTSLKQLIQFA